MNKAVLKNALGTACVVIVPGVLVPYIKHPENFTFAFALFVLIGIGVIGGLFYYLDSTVIEAQVTGPNNTPLKWYGAPALWIGVPMLGLCIYVIAH